MVIGKVEVTLEYRLETGDSQSPEWGPFATLYAVRSDGKERILFGDYVNVRHKQEPFEIGWSIICRRLEKALREED